MIGEHVTRTDLRAALARARASSEDRRLALRAAGKLHEIARDVDASGFDRGAACLRALARVLRIAALREESPPARHVLVVDSDAEARAQLAGLVASAGWAPRQAASGEAALESIEQELPAVVLLELMQPRLSGLELLARIRHRDPTLPVIVVTAFANVAGAVAAMRTGADDYLSKPPARGDLIRALHAFDEADAKPAADPHFSAEELSWLLRLGAVERPEP